MFSDLLSWSRKSGTIPMQTLGHTTLSFSVALAAVCLSLLTCCLDAQPADMAALWEVGAAGVFVGRGGVLIN